MTSVTTDVVRILVVDDHAMFREALADLIQKSSDLVVVGKCGSSDEAIALLESTRPSVILLDFDLGADCAMSFLEKARAIGFDGRVLVVTAGVTEFEAIQLVQAGVAGILHKHNSPDALRETIRKVTTGEVCLEKNYLKPLFRAVNQIRPGGMVRLTERDKKILHLVFQGLSNKLIGARLNLSEGGVKAAIRQLFQKLGVHTRAEMVKVALEDYRDQL